MFDKLTTLAIHLLDKHLILGSIVIGVLSLYLLDFNADKLVETKYAIFAFIVIDIFVRIASYIHLTLKLDGTKTSINKATEMTDKIETLLDMSESIANIHVDIVSNIHVLNKNILKLCEVMKGIPNKPQLRFFIAMRTKLYLMEIVEQCVSYIFNNSLMKTPPTSVSKQKINLDFYKKKEAYYKDIQIYLNPNIVITAKYDIEEEINRYITEVVNLIDSNMINDVEKLYTLMIYNTTSEEKLVSIWNDHISNLPDGVLYSSMDETKDVV